MVPALPKEELDEVYNRYKQAEKYHQAELKRWRALTGEDFRSAPKEGDGDPPPEDVEVDYLVETNLKSDGTPKFPEKVFRDFYNNVAKTTKLTQGSVDKAAERLYPKTEKPTKKLPTSVAELERLVDTLSSHSSSRQRTKEGREEVAEELRVAEAALREAKGLQSAERWKAPMGLQLRLYKAAMKEADRVLEDTEASEKDIRQVLQTTEEALGVLQHIRGGPPESIVSGVPGGQGSVWDTLFERDLASDEQDLRSTVAALQEKLEAGDN